MNIGVAYNSLKESRKAIEYHEESLRIAREIKNKTEESKCYENLGIAHNSLKNFIKATAYHKEALGINKKIQKSIIDRSELINAEVDLIKELPFPEIEENWDIKDVSNLLTNYSAVLVKKNNKYIGIITDADLLQIS